MTRQIAVSWSHVRLRFLASKSMHMCRVCNTDMNMHWYGNVVCCPGWPLWHSSMAQMYSLCDARWCRRHPTWIHIRVCLGRSLFPSQNLNLTTLVSQTQNGPIESAYVYYGSVFPYAVSSRMIDSTLLRLFYSRNYPETNPSSHPSFYLSTNPVLSPLKKHPLRISA